MRRQHYYPPSKWTKEFRKAIKLSHLHYAVYACLEGGPQSDRTGLYLLFTTAIAGMVRVDVGQVEQVLVDLEEADLIVWDAESEVVWVPCVCEEQHSWSSEEAMMRDKQIIQSRRYIASLPDCRPVDLFLKRWPAFSKKFAGGADNEK
jgi:hypothetical protein